MNKLIKLIKKIINEEHHHIITKELNKKYENEAKLNNIQDLDRNLFYIIRRDNPLKSFKNFEGFNKALSNIPSDRMQKIEYKINLGGEDIILSVHDYEKLISDLKKVYEDILKYSKDFKIKLNQIDQFDTTSNKKHSATVFNPKEEIKNINNLINILKKSKSFHMDNLPVLNAFKQKLNDIGKQLYPIWYNTLVRDYGIDKKDLRLQTDTITKSFHDSPKEKKMYSYPHFDPRGFKK